MRRRQTIPKWLTVPVMVLRSELRLRFRGDETAFLRAYPQVRKMKFKARNYILTGRVYR